MKRVQRGNKKEEQRQSQGFQEVPKRVPRGIEEGEKVTGKGTAHERVKRIKW